MGKVYILIQGGGRGIGAGYLVNIDIDQLLFPSFDIKNQILQLSYTYL